MTLRAGRGDVFEGSASSLTALVIGFRVPAPVACEPDLRAGL
jgi:hypothetical protein